MQPPIETLPADETVARDRDCAASEKSIKAGCCPRPRERYQFLRGTMDAMTDIIEPAKAAVSMLQRIHQYHLRELEFWVKTDVDGIQFMDDWGARDQLLIPPTIWRDLFKPMYRDYCGLAHAHGKLTFMHSDGHISEIYPDLVEVGVDALNSQLFCMDLADLAAKARAG